MMLSFFRLIFSSLSLFSTDSDSEKTNIIRSKVIVEIIHHKIAVAKYQIGRLKESEPRAGHTSRDIPKTALLNHSIFERSFLSVRSANIAFETAVFHPVIPSSILAKNITKIGKSKNQKISVDGSR